MTLKNSSVEA